MSDSEKSALSKGQSFLICPVSWNARAHNVKIQENDDIIFCS